MNAQVDEKRIAELRAQYQQVASQRRIAMSFGIQAVGAVAMGDEDAAEKYARMAAREARTADRIEAGLARVLVVLIGPDGL